MNYLNTVSSEYKPNAITQIENKLMLSWYPKRIINKIKNSDKKSLLELGLGHGYTTPYFYEHFASHTVLEGSDVVIAQFNETYKLKNIKIIETYFENYESEEKFDVIIMGFILEHVEDPLYILKKFKNHLKPDGKLFITVPNAKCLNRRMGFAMGKISDIYSLNTNDLNLGHRRNYCFETLQADIVSAGYEVCYKEGIYLKPLPLPYMQNMPEFEENLNAMLEVGIDFPELSVALLVEVRNA